MSEISVSGTRFLLDGKPFAFTGVSFFNAIFNPTFNSSSEDRTRWMQRFLSYGINVLRIWGQWDCLRGFADTSPDATLFHPDGRLRQGNIERLRALLLDADRLGMVIELAILAAESKEDGRGLPTAAAERATQALTTALIPHRNLTLQVWNECSDDVALHVRAIRSIDAKRLVTNSPGYAGILGDDAQNNLLDYLSPHTTRDRAWENGPREIASLLAKFRKPVVDDEPARNGTPKFGGPKEATSPLDHILQIHQVWNLGAYNIYHHDMFQTGYGTPAVPPSGIPDPQFNPYHREVFDFLAMQGRYRPK